MSPSSGKPARKERSEGFLKYFRNTSWLFVDKVVRLGAVLITSIFVTRYLGPELFGQLNYASAFVGIFFALTAMGLDDILIRDIVRRPDRRDQLMGTAAAIKLGGAVVLFITVMTLAFAKNMDTTTIMMVFLIASAEFLKPLVVVEQYFYSQVKGRTAAQVNMITVIIASLFRLGLIVVHAPLVWFAWAYIIEMGASAIGFLIAYRREGSTWKNWRYSKETALYLLRQSWPLVIYGLALYVQAKIDQVMIGDILKHTLGEKGALEEVGQYSAALKMIEALGFVPGIVVASLAPAITRARATDRKLYEDRLVNQYRLMFILFLLVSVPLFFIAEPVMVLLFGEKFRMAGYLLSLFAIRLFFTNMGVAKSSFITNESMFKYSLVTAVVGATLNITLNYLLIPTYQSIGAIWAMIGSFFVSIFLVDLFFKEARPNFGWMMKGIFTFWKVRNVN
ncbi:MAG TPA: flippase [Flavobacteriales bacterium]|mgnify:CR=1 FL=1|jgi:O-antigen/teichoic acid export membrane protein|nr:flippase [Flavobacteriales bacterium]QQS72455.1 MAG: flippase [Flavobacteriales bacterium]HQV39487.1 flippase [Flavobacteriales bacterium]HQW33377.1 flippase [Flavobacteriales bacterium]HQY03657.1 flippase [Flavobacteriales bacterium]